MDLDPQARQLNDLISAGNPSVMTMLSERGRAIYFPKMGILAQSAEARGKDIDATIGIALEEDGTPMRLPCIAQRVQLPPEKIFAYAPSSGRPELRQVWKDMLVKKNPALAGKAVSLPVVTGALSHGLSMTGYLFCDPGDRIILPDLYWENYDLIFHNAYGASLDPFPTFAGAGFNVAGFRQKVMAGIPRKTLVCLNFPNNPTGYTPTGSEVEGIVSVLREAAARGSRLVVIIDDAYFGLVYEPGVFAESIFGLLCDLHPNLLAVKLDGATKEDYVWGLRVGFMTYGIRGGTPPLYQALEAKTAGAIRGNVSNGSNLGQSLLVSAFASPAYASEKQQKYELLRSRYEKVNQVIAAHPEYRGEFVPMPFNSGYFMCLKMMKADPERVRQKLLSEYSTGVIVMSGLVRLAFSSTPLDKIEKLFDNVFQAARSVSAPAAE